MPIYRLNSQLAFPDPNEAEDGIVAVGGDLSPERVMLAYRSGIFPWYSAEEPIIWWSPDPRFVLYPQKLIVSKSMKQEFKKGNYTVTFDRNFRDVINQCALQKREGQHGTWITPDMIEAYCKLHEMGYAHSVEVWKDEQLAGGLYGIAIGKLFCGESMFYLKPNASKYGFIALVQQLVKQNYQLIDCQVYTEHLGSLGAEEMPRINYLKKSSELIQIPATVGKWSSWENN